MRIKKRINIISKALITTKNKRKVLNFWFENTLTTENINDLLISWKNANQKDIKTFWSDSPDLRLSQVLVNMEIIPNISGFWYYHEEDDLMIKANILEPRDIVFWGKNYNKDGVKLRRTVWKLIKNLSTDHIKAIVEMSFDKPIFKKYLNYFETELKIRHESKS